MNQWQDRADTVGCVYSSGVSEHFGCVGGQWEWGLAKINVIAEPLQPTELSQKLQSSIEW